MINTTLPFNIGDYDKFILMTSGGKDSTADLCHCLDLGIPKEKIELWHHEIDGEGEQFMDWPVTPAYVKAFAKAFELPLYMSWREGGFYREMMRDNQPTAPVWFEEPVRSTGLVYAASRGGNGPNGTRLKFPQVGADLKTRWCSAYLKIDVADIALRHQERFKGIKTLVITGERAEESPSRAKYATFEPHRADLRDGKKFQRHIDHWRPVHAWPEKMVWEIIERYKINVHPCYHLGWGRLSCQSCIFGSCDQWASCAAVAPESIARISAKEAEFKCTINRKLSVPEMIEKGKPYGSMTLEMMKKSQSVEYNDPIFIDDWKLPAGAYGDSAGPT